MCRELRQKLEGTGHLVALCDPQGKILEVDGDKGIRERAEKQPYLLRVLEEGHVVRVGELHPKRVDVRVVAATNRDLTEDIRSGRFRPDLFCRLSSFVIAIPP